ncbi:MAG: pyridoxal-5'-phosphate-dependent protein subunit beta, partial [Streptomyces sp.]|nr:pyridoxal-5'-phosphate-dependent protein subunit beta [Streptomyces sp.]
HLPADDPDEITHPTDRVVTRWTRCTRITDPLTTAGRPVADEHALAGAAR